MDLRTRRTGHYPPLGPSVDWWVLTTINTAETKGLTCLPKHGGARDSKFLVTHPMTDQCCLASAIVCRAHWLRSYRAPHQIHVSRSNFHYWVEFLYRETFFVPTCWVSSEISTYLVNNPASKSPKYFSVWKLNPMVKEQLRRIIFVSIANHIRLTVRHALAVQY
jgi:hypothetical protein